MGRGGDKISRKASLGVKRGEELGMVCRGEDS
jgi:hypothetical protein